MALSSDVIFFGIQAVLKLKSTAKEAQIAQIKKQSLKLVLPGGLPSVNAESAKSYFVFDEKGQEQLRSASERVKYLVREMRAGRLDDEAERKELVEAYYTIRNYDEGNVKVKHAEGLEAQQVFALLHLKQWEDDTTISPLQSVVGSVINLGVSLLQMKPDLVNSNTSQGKLLKSFLSGFDSVDFANTPTNDIVSGLMCTTIELLDKGAILGADSSTQQFLKKVTEGVATDISTHIQKTKAAGNSNLQKEDAARNWGTTVFRSVIQNAGATALGNPMTFLGANAENNTLIQTVGNALLDVILNDVVTEDGKEIKLSSFINQRALDTITRASVVVLSEHPEWYEFDNEGIKNVVTGVVRELAAYPDASIFDMLPNLVNSLLTLTAGNLELIYQGDPSKPHNNILLTAICTTLSSLKAAAPKQAGEKWKPVFSKGQAVELIDTVFQAVITKPDWLLNKVDNRPILEEALTSVLTSLKGKALSSLNSATRLSIIRSALSSVALSQNLLKKVKIGRQQKNLLSASLDIVIDLAFKDNTSANVKWALVSGNAATMLIDATLHRISAEGASVEVLGLVRQFLEGEFSGLEKDKNFSLTNLIEKLKSPDSIQTLLINSFDVATRVISQLMLENPNVSNIQNEGVKNIINGLFSTLKDYPKQLGEDLLPDLVKSILGKTAENLEMIFPGDQTKPTNNLLYQTTQMVLNTLSTTANANGGNLKIAFSKIQLVGIIDFALQEVVAKPQWILEKLDNQPLLQTALGAALSSLDGIPIHQMNNDTRIIIMQSTLSAVAHNNALLHKARLNGKMKSIASGAIDMTLSFIFGDKSSAKAQLGLVSGEAAGALTNAVLNKLALEGASHTVLDMIHQFLEGELLGMKAGQPFSLENLVAKLQSKESLQTLLANSADQITRIAATALTEHPNLIQLHNTGVRTIVNSLAQSLSKFPTTINKAALGTIANTLLTHTAQHFSLVYKNGISNPSNNFLLESVETLLGELVQEDGNIRLAFNTLQLTDVTNFVVQQVIQKPNWVMMKLVGGNTMLQATLTTTLEVMTDSAFTGLNNESMAKILKSAIMAAGTRIELLDRLSMTDGEKETVLSGALDFVLKTAAGDAGILTNIDEMILPKIKWALSDNDTVSALADAVLKRIAAEGGNVASLAKTKELVVKEITRIANGDNFSIKSLINKLLSEENLLAIMA